MDIMKSQGNMMWNYSLISIKYATHFMWMWLWLQFNKVLSNAKKLSLENDELSSLYKVCDVPLKDNSSIYDTLVIIVGKYNYNNIHFNTFENIIFNDL
jgi:hypothetical protein